MQRVLTILLLLVLGLPSVAPVFAIKVSGVQAADGQLPACCRRDGQHHCMMSMAEKRAMLSRERNVSAPLTPCPFCPRTLIVIAQGPLFAPPPAAVLDHDQAASPFRLHLPATHLLATARDHNARGPPHIVIA